MSLLQILRSLETQIRRNWLAHRVARVIVQSIGAAVSVPLYLARVRFLRLTAPSRIGHLCTDPAMFVKKRKLGMIGWCVGVLVIPPRLAANECLLEYWRRYITVIRSPFWAYVLNGLTRFNYLVYDTGTHAINETSPHIAVERQWGQRPALLQLTAEQRSEGAAVLRALGVPQDTEWVCVHCREHGFSASDDDSQAYRDSSIENYLSAVDELTKRGLWCFRMGGPTTRPLARRDRFIDYAHSNVRSDRMDVFLSASCKFFLGGSSGLLWVANTFGRPTGSANHAPLSTVLAFGANDVAIPKLLWSDVEKRYLTFAEAFGSDVSNFRYLKLYEEQGIRTVENSADDIRDLALEMLDRLAGRAVYTPADEQRQHRFRELMRPGHYSYGGLTRLGREFLRKYESLLG